MTRMPAPWTLLTATLFVAAGAVHSIRLTAPFTHYHENVTACYANFGRNYLRLGYGKSGFLPVWAVAPDGSGDRLDPKLVYSHRPPLVSLLVSLSCRLFGANEGAVRLVGVLATLGTLAVFWAVARRLLGRPWGTAAAAILAFIPDFAFYGVAIAHQTFGLMGGLLILLFYLRWREQPSRGRLAALAAVTVFSCCLDWPAFYGAGAVGLLHLLRERGRRTVALLVPACALAALALFVLYLYCLDPRDNLLLKDFLNTGGVHSAGVPLGSYIALLAAKAVRWFTVPVLLLSALGAARLRPRTNFEDAALLSTLLLAADQVLFRSMTFGHPFLTVPAAPFLALTAARGIRFLSERRWTLAVAGLLLVGFVGQAVQTLSRAHAGGSFPYYGEVSRALGAALRSATGPEERTLVRLLHDPHITGWYGDRRITAFDSKGRTLEPEDTRMIEREVDEAALLRKLGSPGHGFSWFVTTTAAIGGERVAALRTLEDAAARDAYDLESERYPSALVLWLRSRCHEQRRNGFLFFDLRSLK